MAMPASAAVLRRTTPPRRARPVPIEGATARVLVPRATLVPRAAPVVKVKALLWPRKRAAAAKVK